MTFIWSQDCCEAEEIATNNCGGVGCYIPQCTENCEWEPMQCWSSTGYCWCVDENGVEIDGTSMPSLQGYPDCEEPLEECFDFSGIDFGLCTMVLGVGLLNDECSYISGCDWTIDGIDYSDLFFDSIEKCEDNCIDDNLIDLGDLNGDGIINVVDIVMLVNIILNGEEYYPVADLNSDGTINVVDIVSLVNLVLYGSDTTIEDIDGNVYEIIEIGEQVWMAENLKTTRYSNGDEIIYIDNPNEWNNNFIGHYAAYNNDLSNVDSYGYLYNWSAANDNRGICPDGFHVPSDQEWSELIQYLDPNTNPFAENHNDVHSSLAGGSLKDTGTIQEGDGLWQSPNTNATNVSGFSALPAGLTNDENQNVDLMGYYLGYLAWYWTSTAIDSDLAWSRELFWSGSDIHRHSITKNYGISVRCVSY